MRLSDRLFAALAAVGLLAFAFDLYEVAALHVEYRSL